MSQDASPNLTQAKCGVQEQLWAYEDADTLREALEARLAASEAQCQQLRADLTAAQHSAVEVRNCDILSKLLVKGSACAMHSLQQVTLLVRPCSSNSRLPPLLHLLRA